MKTYLAQQKFAAVTMEINVTELLLAELAKKVTVAMWIKRKEMRIFPCIGLRSHRYTLAPLKGFAFFIFSMIHGVDVLLYNILERSKNAFADGREFGHVAFVGEIATFIMEAKQRYTIKRILICHRYQRFCHLQY